jgi:hypothetical protein
MQEKASFAEAINSFEKDVHSLQTSTPMVGLLLTMLTIASHRAFSEFLQRHGKPEDSGADGDKTYTIPREMFSQTEDTERRCDTSRRALAIVTRSFLVSLVSQFDAFIGKLLRTMYLTKPELLNASERALTLTELRQLGSLDAACEHLIEEEVESLLRKSHADQFKSLETKLAIPLTKDLPAWSRFIEVTERRNLFVHCDGVVSRQYRDVCRKHGVAETDICESGVQLKIDPEYFQLASAAVLEVGIKLGQVVWRKLVPDQLDAADQNVLDMTFDLIRRGQHGTAIAVLTFADATLLRNSEARTKMVAKINLAQACRWSGDLERCKTIVANTDWSAYADDFRLARAVLLDEYPTAADIMRRIGKHGPLSTEAYQQWPIFREFRKTEQFRNAYLDVFGTAFTPPESESVTALSTQTHWSCGSSRQMVSPHRQALATLVRNQHPSRPKHRPLTPAKKARPCR